MNKLPAFPSILQRVLRLSTRQLDAADRRPRVWAAVLSGAGLGCLWGIAARIWMRLISTQPEFSVEGTAFILIVTTVFGAWAGLAFAARRRGWRGWRHYLPRSLAVLFFLPLGFGGGMILMVTVLLATLAVTQSVLGIVWAIGLLVVPLGVLVGLRGGGVELVAAGLLALALAVTAWKWLARRWRGRPRAQQIDRWIERIVRTLLMLLAIGGVWEVASGVLSAKPGWRALLYMLFYLGLLYPVFLALRIALKPRQAHSQDELPDPEYGASKV
jgi:hypothetical protein